MCGLSFRLQHGDRLASLVEITEITKLMLIKDFFQINVENMLDIFTGLVKGNKLDTIAHSLDHNMKVPCHTKPLLPVCFLNIICL